MEGFMWRVLNYVSVCKRQVAAGCSPGQRTLRVAAARGLLYFWSDGRDLWEVVGFGNTNVQAFFRVKC